ncbi:metaphase-anaphase transition protein mlo2 [Zymoseptoria brevis]|uniref:Metaphase-anaphase transition protein mlo2 n=1 Tax=Zymoseptoria brevis TaxID=1047168 RepID=A0A0F4GN46_9PEZI|nr:metaphase-anaphase transition protein mlo2 [Zymoseptoria brevis]
MSSTDATPPVPSKRTSSISAASETSQTAHDYIASQLSLEAEAREALPYQFDTCTKPLGPLRQTVYACLTCTPPPASKYQQFTPAGVCYSCSISCHGEHNLVELFTKRDFECDCGTTRLDTSGTPCNLRLNAATGQKGGVKGKEAREGNLYNQNFEGKFCGCGEEYDPEKEKGTMFQCLGLGHVQDGGCGEDWWHPECLMGLPRTRHEEVNVEANGALETVKEEAQVEANGALETVKEEGGDGEKKPAETNGSTEEHSAIEDPPPPPGFPAEDDFDHLICYKCVDAYPWIKQYAGTPGFLPAVPADGSSAQAMNGHAANHIEPAAEIASVDDSKKRKADDELEDSQESNKKAKPDTSVPLANGSTTTESAANGIHIADAPIEPASVPVISEDAPAQPKHLFLPPATTTKITLFTKEDFRDHLCRCASCFPRLKPHRQLLEEEEVYEPPVSESSHNGDDAGSATGSLLSRGEAALSSMDRVRAIEGVMAYNHVRDVLKPFLKSYADRGEAVGAEDINAFFAKLRGDEAAMREAAAAAGASNGGVDGDGRREQGGY